MVDVHRRCGMTKTWSGTLRHVWVADLRMDLKVRLYIMSTCCIILVYGSDPWVITAEVQRSINETNA